MRACIERIATTLSGLSPQLDALSPSCLVVPRKIVVSCVVRFERPLYATVHRHLCANDLPIRPASRAHDLVGEIAATYRKFTSRDRHWAPVPPSTARKRHEWNITNKALLAVAGHQPSPAKRPTTYFRTWSLACCRTMGSERTDRQPNEGF